MGSERREYKSLKVALVSVKAILACVPVFVLPFGLKPSAELFVVGWGCVTAWFRPPFLYLVLNVVIVTLGVKSGALNYSSTQVSDDSSGDSQMNNTSDVKSGALTYSSTSDQTQVSDDSSEDSQMNNSADVYTSKVVDSDESEDKVAVKEEVAVSKPGKEECGETQLVSSDLIEEVGEGQITASECNEEKEEEMLSAEELYEKSEMFIGNFYRELKLQQIE